jgi:hypothetical protein
VDIEYCSGAARRGTQPKQNEAKGNLGPAGGEKQQTTARVARGSRDASKRTGAEVNSKAATKKNSDNDGR